MRASPITVCPLAHVIVARRVRRPGLLVVRRPVVDVPPAPLTRVWTVPPGSQVHTDVTMVSSVIAC